MKRILCFDWLSERARSAHLAGLSCVGRARKFSLFGFFMASGRIVNNFLVSYYTFLVLAITIITYFYNY